MFKATNNVIQHAQYHMLLCKLHKHTVYTLTALYSLLHQWRYATTRLMSRLMSRACSCMCVYVCVCVCVCVCVHACACVIAWCIHTWIRLLLDVQVGVTRLTLGRGARVARQCGEGPEDLGLISC